MVVLSGRTIALACGLAACGDSGSSTTDASIDVPAGTCLGSYAGAVTGEFSTCYAEVQYVPTSDVAMFTLTPRDVTGANLLRISDFVIHVAGRLAPGSYSLGNVTDADASVTATSGIIYSALKNATLVKGSLTLRLTTLGPQMPGRPDELHKDIDGSLEGTFVRDNGAETVAVTVQF